MLCLFVCLYAFHYLNFFFTKAKHIAAFFGLKFFFGVTTNSDAYDAARVHFAETLVKYSKLSKEHKQKIFHLAELQLQWVDTLMPDTEAVNVAIAKSSDDGDEEVTG